VDNQPVSGRDIQVRRLLKLLAAYPNGVDTQYAIEFLYSDKATQHQASALRKVLQRLRSLLGGDSTVQRNGEYLRLNRNLCWVDADAFTELLRQKNGIARQQAIDLYRGEFLSREALEDIELMSRREILRGAFQRVVLERLDELDDSPGIELCHWALDIEPLSEVIYQCLIGIYQHIGRADLAMASYEQCRRLMLNELGTEPTQMTRRIAFQE
jgi:DNA-binding SARP family transcriptional activator